MSVTWTQSGGSYEISSPEHLKQLMNKGTLYSDSGSNPTDYWASNYIQTSDIDLLSDSTNIKPIGIDGDIFYGEYDGGSYTISNWSYVDPNRNSTTEHCEIRSGLFGYVQDGILKNIRLSGIYNLQGSDRYAGFLVGYAKTSNIYNVVCGFDATMTEGTKLSTTTTYIGGVIGYVSGVYGDTLVKISGIDVSGTIDLCHGSRVAGVIGTARNSEMSFLRNAATFPSGLFGKAQSCGLVNAWYSNLSDSINIMTGNITSDNISGGICGAFGGNSSIGVRIDNVVNAMTGNISASGGYSPGGIIGYCLYASVTSAFNYMNGDISGTAGGGIIGRVYSTVNLYTSVNAMNGDVDYAVVRLGGSTDTRATVDTSFGLTYTTNDWGLTPPLTGFLTLPEFPDLPYFELNGTDDIGNSYDYDFVFANLGGNLEYTNTHLVISKGSGTFQDGIFPEFEEVEVDVVDMGTSFVTLEWNDSGHSEYSINTKIGDSVLSTHTTSKTSITLTNLVPSTTYTFELTS